MKQTAGIPVLSSIFCFFLFVCAAFAGTVDDATLSPANIAIKPGDMQTLEFSATNDKTFDIKTYHAEFAFTKGLNITDISTSPVASKATINSSRGILTLEWNSIAAGATIMAALNVSGAIPGTFNISPLKITYSENRKTVYNGGCNSVQIIIQDQLSGTVTGTVSDASTGTPIESAFVTIKDSAQAAFSTLTDSSGNYSAIDLFPGDFTASFWTPGYNTLSTGSTVSAGQQKILNASLRPLTDTSETIRPTDAYNPGGWPTPLKGFDSDVSTYASGKNINTVPSISFGGAASNESINAWQGKLQYWNSAWLYLTFEGIKQGQADDLMEFQVTDRLGNIKHVLTPPVSGITKKGFAQKLKMADWGDGFNNIADLRLRVNGYRKKGADNAEARVYDLRINGDPSPLVKNFTRGSYTILPADSSDLRSDFTPSDMQKAGTDDDSRVTQSALYSSGEYAVHQFREKQETRNIRIKWNGRIESASTSEAYAFSFIPVKSGRLTQISIYLRKAGTPDGSLKIRLKSEPGGVTLSESLPLSETSITSLGGWQTFDFPNPAYASSGGTYYAEIWRDKLDINNYPIVRLKECRESSGLIRYSGDWFESDTILFDTYTENSLDISSFSCPDVLYYPFEHGIEGLDPRTIYLETYNRATASWVRLDSAHYDGSISDITLAATVSSADYFDDDSWIAVRAYADTINKNLNIQHSLSTDFFGLSTYGEISVEPMLLDFGSVTAGSSSTKEIRVSNSGIGDLMIDTIATPSAPFSIISDNCSGTVLPASAACRLSVMFSPASENSSTGAITVAGNDPFHQNTEIILQGTGVPLLLTLNGSVTDSVSGLSLPGAGITITDTSGTRTAATDLSGTYLIEGLRSGGFSALFDKSGYITQTIDGTLPLRQTFTLDVRLSPIPPPEEGTLTGTVKDSITGIPLSMAVITVTDSLNMTKTVATGQDGAFIITALHAGALNGSINRDGYVSCQFTGELSAGQTITVNAALTPSFALIENQAVVNITTDSATVIWTTDMPSDSLVEYGETDGYGNPVSDPVMTTGHNIVLTGLKPSTVYHFKISSTNSYGVTTSTTDATFATLSPITLTIITPSEADTVAGSEVMVRGTFSNASGRETGVTVNGIVASVYGSQFIANHVPLTEGANTITVTATDIEGNSLSKSISANAVTAGKYIRLTSNIESGISPLQISLRIDGSFSVTASNISVTGPGHVEFLPGDLVGHYEAVLTTEGIYYFTATVTGPDNIVYQDTVAVVVLNKTQLDVLLKAKWEGMKGALSSLDISGAANYYSTETRELYIDIFRALYAQLPQLTQNMQDIQLIYVKNATAIYRIRQNELYGGQMVPMTYHIYFTIDSDGIWKIYRY